MMRRRVSAVAALLLGAAAITLAVVVFVTNFPRGVGVLACMAAAVAAAWYGVRRRGVARALGLVGAAVLVAGAIALVVLEGSALADALIVTAALGALAAAKAAFAVHVALPAASRPQRAVLFLNPRSGSGKADKFHLVEEARRRGIEPVTLHRGDDLRQLVREAVANGADALAMAGGDGSQAIVAAIASETRLPYACIPAGTRNHFALDLGVDRNDVVGALDAFVDGGERVVDLADVNGRVFVNNVSLGLYAEAVQRSGYRDAKLRTLLDTVPDVLGDRPDVEDLHWTGTGSAVGRAGAGILVSNNSYRLARPIGSGTRPRMDRGVLGVTVIGGSENGQVSRRRPWVEWAAPSFEVDADRPVPAGIDGEATVLDPPLRFRTHPRALQVRIARAHPGAAPSVLEPEGARATIEALARIAVRGTAD